MTIDKEKLKTALSLIHNDGGSYLLSGRFVDLSFVAHVKSAHDVKFRKPNRYLKFIQEHLWNLETIVLRLAWQKDLWSKGKLDEISWMIFAKCDINYFHVEFRSLFDHLTKLVSTVSDSPGQVKSRSFHKLKNWLAKSDQNVRNLGRDLAKLVLSCGWFDDLKTIRESIIHKGGFTLVFLEKNRILFQVHEGISRKVLIPEVMFNENVVDFELYAGLYLSYLLAYLEEISEAISNRLDLKSMGNPRNYHSGLRILNDWIKQVLNLAYPKKP